MFHHMYIAQGRGRQSTGDNFDGNRKAFSLCPYCASFKIISSKSDFIHICNDEKLELLMSTESPYHFDHLLQVSNKSL